MCIAHENYREAAKCIPKAAPETRYLRRVDELLNIAAFKCDFVVYTIVTSIYIFCVHVDKARSDIWKEKKLFKMSKRKSSKLLKVRGGGGGGGGGGRKLYAPS